MIEHIKKSIINIRRKLIIWLAASDTVVVNAKVHGTLIVSSGGIVAHSEIIAPGYLSQTIVNSATSSETILLGKGVYLTGC